jgi:hypothetical protein
MSFGYVLQGTADNITAIVKTATDQHRSITLDERTSIVSALRQLAGSLQQMTSQLDGLKPEIVLFVRTITNDTQPLAHGSQDLGKAIDTIQETAANEAIKYMTPDGMGIYKLILEWGGAILTRLRALQTTLNPLSAANERSQHSLQGMLTIFTTVTEKYKAVADVLAMTQTSLDDFSLLPDLLEVAALSWKDVTDYLWR